MAILKFIYNFTEMKPEITVIIPVYNQEKTVERAVRSVLTQEVPVPYEIILSDDASSDSTPMICSSLGEKYPGKIRVILHEKNRGIVRNYFNAFGLAEGKYIADCAGDDYWSSSHHLSSLLHLLERYPDAGIAHSAWFRANPTDNTLSLSVFPDRYNSLFREYSDAGSLLANILSHDPSPLIHLSASLYRKELLQRHLEKDPDIFLSRENLCEDLPITAVLAAFYPVAYTPQPSLAYTINPASISNSNDSRKRFKLHYSALMQTLGLARHLGFPVEKLSGYIDDQANYLMSLAFDASDSSMCEKACRLRSEHGVSFSLKSRLIAASFGNCILSGMLRYVKKLLSAIKRN